MVVLRSIAREWCRLKGGAIRVVVTGKNETPSEGVSFCIQQLAPSRSGHDAHSDGADVRQWSMQNGRCSAWTMQCISHRPFTATPRSVQRCRHGLQLGVVKLVDETAEWLMGDATALYTIVLLHQPSIIQPNGA